MAMVTTTVRMSPDYETNNVWAGKTEEVLLSGDLSMLAAKLEEACLWYFQFNSPSFSETYQYFGVMDFDLHVFPLNKSDSELKTILLADPEIREIIRLVEERFDCFNIYFSGKKGIHVYVFNDELFTCPPPDQSKDKSRLLWIKSFLNKAFGEELVSLLDESIYPINKGIRPYSIPHPKTGRRPFLIYQKGNESCIWSYIVENKIWEKKKTYIPEISNFIGEQKKTNIASLPAEAIVLSESNLDIKKQIVDYFDSKPGKLAGCKIDLVKSTNGNIKNLYRLTGTTYCPIKSGCHSETGKVNLYLYGCHATVKCFKGKCSGKEYTIKKMTKPLTCISDLIVDLSNRKEIAQRHLETVTIGPEQKYVGVPDIEWSIGNEDVAKYGYIAAPMSCGKTTSLRTYIDNQSPSFTCLLIVVRQSQAYTFAPIYPEMKNYLECPNGSLYGVGRLVVCINSLTRVYAPGGILPSYDLLILDEFESILDTITNPSLSNGKSLQLEVWDTLMALIKCCKRTIFMDGIPTEESVRYLDKIGILPFLRIVEMPRQVDYRKYIIFSHGVMFIEGIEEQIKNGKKIVLVSNCKAILQTVYDGINVPSGNKMIITGDSERDVKLTSSNPDLYWNKDLFAFNSAVGPGTSFNPHLYDEMNVIITPNSSPPQVLFQMINRIRTLNDKIVRMVMLSGNNTKIPTLEQLKEKKMQNIISMQNKQGIYPKTAFFSKMDKEYFRLTVRDLDQKIAKELVANQMMILRHEDDLFLDMLTRADLKKRQLENSDFYLKELCEMIRRNGGIVREESGDPDKLKKVKETTTRIFKKMAKEHEVKRTLEVSNRPLWTLPVDVKGKYTEQQLVDLNTRVPRNDLDAQFMWLLFRKSIMKESEQELYESEFFELMTKKKAINNTILFSNGLLDDIKTLCTISGIEIDDKKGIIKGTVTTSLEFYEMAKQINGLCEKIMETIRNKTQICYKLCTAKEDSITKYNRAALLNISRVFSCFGIHSAYAGTNRRISVPGKKNIRYTVSVLKFDEEMQKFRMSLANRDPETGEIDHGAFDKFVREMKI